MLFELCVKFSVVAISTFKEEIDSYTKDGIAILVLKKIYSMAPEKCSSCCKSYYFKPGEYCALNCIRCNRGACIECYEREKDKLHATIMFNKNLFYACTDCTNVIREQDKEETNHRKKSVVNKTTNVNPTITEQETITLEEGSEEESETDVDDLTEGINNLGLNKADKDISENITSEHDKSEKVDVEKEKEAKKPKAKPENIHCKYYQKNICQHGISGKGCKYFHQKPCTKLLKFGSCQKDGKCSLFHPPMCKYSLQKRVCSNPKCEFMHVKGTRRDAGKPRNILNAKPVKNSYKKKETSRGTRTKQTYSSVVKNVNTAADGKKRDKSTTENTAGFLGVGLPNPNPPPVAFGAGSGEEMKMMINLMNQLVQILQPAATKMHQLPPQPIQVQAQPIQVQAQPIHQMMYQHNPLQQRVILQ
jgi:hypothetical protein